MRNSSENRNDPNSMTNITVVLIYLYKFFRFLGPVSHSLVLHCIICSTFIVLRVCKILIDDDVLRTNIILLGMYDVDVILGMDWLSTHRASVDSFTKKIVFQKLGYPELEFEGDQKILPKCVISTLEAKRLLHKG